ncbi:FAD-dependent oxidoreductase [Hoeflea sp.]|uniref:flavin monoamine oxidase family protein n=1 Tax=Hoeflea sp. TaxID=1940281 RepID=UPI003B01283E
MDRRAALSLLGAGFVAGFVPWTGANAENRRLRGYIRTNWSRDPYSRGSYSYVARGARQRDRRRIESPVNGRIFFAGEAVYPDYNSTVHAAYESGQRTAGFVLDRDLKKVAIVGAGMSGLSAASRLAAEGVEVTIFEARDRIGGRIWTDNHLGLPLDLGASWIHGITGNPLTGLADELALKRIATDDSGVIRGRGGRLIPDGSAPDWLEEVVEVQHSAGANDDQINYLAYLLQDDYDGDEVIFPGGYAAIFRALDGNYSVKLSSPVSGIKQERSGVSVITAVSGSQMFDAVIVTLPLGVMKKDTVRFDPPLPAKKRKAIERLGMGTLDKVYFLFDAPFWDTDVTWIATPENDLPPGQFNGWLNLHKYTGQPVIMAFNGGPPALELAGLPDNEIVQRGLQTLLGAYPD